MRLPPLTAVALCLSSAAALADAPTTTTARADGKGKVDVHIVYFAEDTCMRVASVREGAPSTIEAPKRSPAITVQLERQGTSCEQKLRTLEHDITIADRAGAKSVEVLFVDKAGKFIRSGRPPIDRPGQDGDELQPR